MLRRLSSNKESFKPIDFRAGMNVVLADQDPEAAQTDSRNARGKTTLLLIINYLLGGNLANQLRPLQGQEWVFSLTIDLFDGQVTVSRSLDTPSAALTISNTENLRGLVSVYVDQGTVSVDAWKELLGLALFRLDAAEAGGSYGLSVRVLLLYVVRTEAGRDPLKAFNNQPAWSSRQHLAFMLGLDWHRVQVLQDLSRKLDALGAVTTAQAAGLLPTFGNEADLLLERSEAQRRLDAQRSRINNFRVLDDPTGMVSRANDLTEQISQLRDDALVDQRMQSLYESALSEARSQSTEPLASELAAIYEQAGSVLGEQVHRRLDEVQAFHDQLTLNREAFLARAIQEIAARTGGRNDQLSALADQRDQLMRAIAAGGALQELLALRDELSQYERDLATAEYRLEQSRELTQSRELMRAERATERQVAQTQLTVNREKLDRVAGRFDARMQRLYGISGVLTAEVDDDGYKFTITVAGQNSTGVNRMKLFCLDISLLEEGAESGHHPDFLIHDSAVYDGVDPRQIAAALSLANEAVSAAGAQYICTLNSNDLAPEVRDAQWFADSIVRVVLDTEDGGILGVSF
jgi:uncharacterized protein YydD (DUF2326 family)